MDNWTVPKYRIRINNFLQLLQLRVYWSVIKRFQPLKLSDAAKKNKTNTNIFYLMTTHRSMFKLIQLWRVIICPFVSTVGLSRYSGHPAPACDRKDFVLNLNGISSLHPSAGGSYYHQLHHQSVYQDVKPCVMWQNGDKRTILLKSGLASFQQNFWWLYYLRVTEHWPFLIVLYFFPPFLWCEY